MVIALLADSVLLGLLFVLLRPLQVRIEGGDVAPTRALVRAVRWWFCGVVLIFLLACDTAIPMLQTTTFYLVVTILTLICIAGALMGLRFLYHVRIYDWQLLMGFLALTLVLSGAAGSWPSSVIVPVWIVVNALKIGLGTGLLIATFVVLRRPTLRAP